MFTCNKEIKKRLSKEERKALATIVETAKQASNVQRSRWVAKFLPWARQMSLYTIIQGQRTKQCEFWCQS